MGDAATRRGVGPRAFQSTLQMFLVSAQLTDLYPKLLQLAVVGFNYISKVRNWTLLTLLTLVSH